MACLQAIIHVLLIIISCYHVKAATVVCNNTATAKMPFCNKNLHYKVRAQDLISRLTLEEKLAQLGDQAPGVQRLGIPPYNWWSEALHGVSDHGIGTHFDNITYTATLFPAVILTAATFNEPLWKQIGVIVSTEARALHNLGLSGLTYWSPETNIARDPRWGRIQETAGEDPLVVARYAVNYVRGLQDVDGHTNVADLSTRSLKVAACCKYFTAYDVEKGKFQFDAQVPRRDLLETFNYPFEMCVKEGDVASIMCSYNQVNGIPTCADPKLLNQTVKGSWGLHGYIVGACDWVMAAVGSQNFLGDIPVDAIAQAYKAGVDLDCRGSYTMKYFADAVKQGKLSEADINQALTNLYVVLLRLGWFDGSHGNYANLGRRDVCAPGNSVVAQAAAQQGIVLLQNEANLLPLNSSNKPNVAVVGPFANATTGMVGSHGNKNGNARHYFPPLMGMSMYANAKYAPGCSDVACADTKGFQAAVDACDGTLVTIVCVGLDSSIEEENLDRENLFLPGNQNKLVETIATSGNTGHVVVVIFSGGGVDVTGWWTIVSSIVWAGYPGPDGGRPLAEIIFGNIIPSGRLPITWYKTDYTKKIPMNSMQLRPNPSLGYPGRTYRFHRENQDVIYPFGYGLSYAIFNYSIASVPKQVTIASQKCTEIIEKEPSGTIPACPAIQVKDSKCQEMVNIVVNVTMNGRPLADDIVFLYSVPPNNIAEALPVKRLIGFKRVSVLQGRSVPLEFSVNACKSFSFVSEDAQELLPAGEHTVVVGNDYTDYLSQPNAEKGNSVTPVKTTISIAFH